MNDALLVRGFERRGNLPRHREGLVDGDRATRDPFGERFTRDQLHDDRAHAAGLCKPWICAMFGWFREASTRASRAKRARRSASLAKW